MQKIIFFIVLRRATNKMFYVYEKELLILHFIYTLFRWIVTTNQIQKILYHKICERPTDIATPKDNPNDKYMLNAAPALS